LQVSVRDDRRGEIIAPIVGDPGEPVICYFDRVGIITGVIDSIISGGISVAFDISPFRHPRVLARLEWHAARELEHIEMRSGARIVPARRTGTIKTSDGYDLSREIIGISLSGTSMSLSSKKCRLWKHYFSPKRNIFLQRDAMRVWSLRDLP
jgi:hypothetical protein